MIARLGRWQHWAALASFFGALYALLRAFAIAFTYGDSRLIPDSACDPACRTRWIAYAHTQYPWLALALCLLLCVPLLLVWARRTPPPMSIR